MRYGKISVGQAALLAFICRVYQIITYTPVYRQDTEILATIIGGALSCIFMAILTIPIFLLFRQKEQNEDIISMCYQVSGIFGTVCHCLFLLCMLGTLLNTVVHFQFFMTNAVFPEAPAALFLGSMLLAAGYAVWMGLEGIARANTIIVVLFALSFLFILFSCFEYADWINLRPILSDSVQSVFDVARVDLSQNIEVIVLMLLFSNLKTEGTAKALWIYLILSSIVLVAVSLITATILGGYEFRQVFPFFSIASIVDMGAIRRFDAIHMVIWTLVTFIRSSVYLLLSSVLIKRFLPGRFQNFVMPCLIIIMFFLSWVTGERLVFMQIVYTFFDNGILTIFLAGVVPLTVWLFRGKKAANRLKGGETK